MSEGPAFEVIDYPLEPHPVGGYVQSPPGVLVPRGLCGLDGCVFLAHHRSDHSWNRPHSSVRLSVDISATKSTKNER